jgi:hypothetical protein
MRPEPTTRPGVTVAFALLGATAAVTIACGAIGDDAQDGEATPTPSATAEAAIPPEEALRLWVERRLRQGFVADCDEAQRPGDVGKQCARFRAERDGMLAYELGPVFSEYTRLIILKRAGDTWTIEHLEERDPALPPVPGIPWPLQVGASVVVAGTGDCLRVRDRPGVQGMELDCLSDGTTVTISSGPVENDDFEWWQLEGHDGWCAGNWLRYPEEAPTGPTATAGP